MRAPRRVLVLWARPDAANYGVRVLAEGMAALARAAWGQDVEVDFRDFSSEIGTRTILRRDLGRRRGPIKRLLGDYDLVLDSGAGDSFADIYGWRRLLVLTYVQRTAAKLRIPIIMGPQTIGPMRSRFARWLARRSLRGMTAILARDPASATFAASLGYPADETVTDVVFALPSPPPAQQRDVLVNISGLLWFGNDHGDSARYRNEVRALVDGLIADGRSVTLLAHVIDSPRGHDDVDAARAFNAETGGDLELLAPPSLHELRAIVAAAQVLIGSRMHACLNALSTGTVAIAWAYSRKFAPLMAELGWDAVVDLRDQTVRPAAATLALVDPTNTEALANAVVRVRALAQPRIADAVRALRLATGRIQPPDASRLGRAVRRVVEADACTGCGVCSLVSDRIRMDLDRAGFLRPTVTASGDAHLGERDREEAMRFRRSCPGVSIRASGRSSAVDPVFGPYTDAWQGWAIDPDLRQAGSSGGVLSALSAWLIESGRSTAVGAVQMSPSRPTTTTPLRLMRKEDVLEAAGSRYAPGSATVPGDDSAAFVGKPCEVAGRTQLTDLRGEERPLLLSFFCAGTPGQRATDGLVRELGAHPASVRSLRYRGNGWPGEFEVVDADGVPHTMPYAQAWGKRLGRQLQSACKLCAVGTGEHADIAVGDYWAADADGYPIFTDGDGNSVVIARTRRGADLLVAAAAEGVLHLEPIDLRSAAQVQPLQTARRLTLPGRLLGRWLARGRVPRYRGYGLVRGFVEHPVANTRAMAGMFLRLAGARR